MRLWLAAGVLFGLAGAALGQTSDDGAARACEAAIIGGLKSPASYKPVKISVEPGRVEVLYDASNAFGALLRDRKQCLFVERSDGLHLVDEPALATELQLDGCAAEVRGWVEAGNLSERAATPFFEQCSQTNQAAQAAFLQSFDDLSVPYPVDPRSTAVYGK